MTAIRVHPGRERGEGDGSRRFLPDAVSFDTRATLLATEIHDDWDAEIKEQWRTNQALVREQLIHQYGAADYELKLSNFIALGAAPWSVVALHNTYLKQIRDAFVSMDYYPALVGACGLGERILNQLILTLREDYSEHPATKHVKGKESFDDWRKCIRTLESWGVISHETKREYLALMKMRQAAVHYRTALDGGDARDAALAAVLKISDLVGRIFMPHGDHPTYFTGPIGRSYVHLSAESDPLVRRFILPACVLVSPIFRFIASGGTLHVYDDPTYGANAAPLTDEEFADPARGTPQVEYPF